MPPSSGIHQSQSKVIASPSCRPQGARPEKARYIAGQKDAVLTAVAQYLPGVPLVFGVDFGHADPQLIIPLGGQSTVSTADRQITVTY